MLGTKFCPLSRKAEYVRVRKKSKVGRAVLPDLRGDGRALFRPLPQVRRCPLEPLQLKWNCQPVHPSRPHPRTSTKASAHSILYILVACDAGVRGQPPTEAPTRSRRAKPGRTA